MPARGTAIAAAVVVIVLVTACSVNPPPYAEDSDTDTGGDAVAPRSPEPGDLVITEIMANPALVSDATGEWFEVYVASTESLDLDGLSGSDAGGNVFVVDGETVVDSGTYLVFGASSDAGVNGGVSVDVVTGPLSLNNGGDTITLSHGGTTVDAVTYGSVTAGASLALSAGQTDAVANDAAANWCDSVASYGDGDLGTPGAANASCP